MPKIFLNCLIRVCFSLFECTVWIWVKIGGKELLTASFSDFSTDGRNQLDWVGGGFGKWRVNCSFADVGGSGTRLKRIESKTARKRSLRLLTLKKL